MPYAKSKSRSYKKGYSKRAGRTVTPYSVAKIAKQVVRAQRPTKEHRVVQSPALNTAALANSFNYDVLTNIGQGDAENQRIGDSIYMVGAKLKFNMHNPHTVPRNLRVMVLQDNSRAGDLLDTTGWSDLFTSNNEADYSATGLYSDVSYPINSNYTIYFDRSYIVPADGTAQNALERSLWVPIRRKVQYDNLGTTSNVPASGKIYVIFHISEMDNTVSSTSSRVSWFARTFYKDT